jgi:hypothetical protein
MTAILLLARNSCINKAESTAVLTWCRNHPDSTLQVILTICFPTHVLRRGSSKVYVEFVLVEKIHNAQLHR